MSAAIVVDDDECEEDVTIDVEISAEPTSDEDDEMRARFRGLTSPPPVSVTLLVIVVLLLLLLLLLLPLLVKNNFILL